MNASNMIEAGAPRVSQGQYLSFLLGRESFAIGILSIKEIIEFSQLTRVPMMPGFVRGVINLRGVAVPVIDLGARFGRGDTAPSRRSCIVIVEVGGGGRSQVVGLLVDGVDQVLEIPADCIEPAPRFGATVPGEMIAGIGKVNGGFIIMVDADAVLAGPGGWEVGAQPPTVEQVLE